MISTVIYTEKQEETEEIVKLEEPVELLLSLEDDYHVEIEMSERIRCVQDLVDAIEQARREKRAKKKR